MGTAVIGGMLAATVIAIFLIPVTFYAMERFAIRFGGTRRKILQATHRLRKKARHISHAPPGNPAEGAAIPSSVSQIPWHSKRQDPHPVRYRPGPRWMRGRAQL